MNKVVLEYKNKSSREVRTKLSDKQKVIEFLKFTGQWSEDIISVQIIENVSGPACNYQNIDN